MKAAEDAHQPLKPLKLSGDKKWMTLEIKQLIKKGKNTVVKDGMIYGARCPYL